MKVFTVSQEEGNICKRKRDQGNEVIPLRPAQDRPLQLTPVGLPAGQFFDLLGDEGNEHRTDRR